MNLLAKRNHQTHHQTSLDFSPGDQWMYSNTDYILAGLIVERISHKTLQQFAEERIFRPLDMKNTTTTTIRRTRSFLTE